MRGEGGEGKGEEAFLVMGPRRLSALNLPLAPYKCLYYYYFYWLFWLSCQYLPSDWLERLLRGRLFVDRRLSPQSTGRRAHNYDFSGLNVLFHCSIACFSCPPALHNILHTPMTCYSLFVL